MANATATKSRRSTSTSSGEEDLHDLLVEKMQVLLDVEQQIIKALPKMAKLATSEELQQCFDEHLKETEQQEKRLEQAFEMLEEKAKPMREETIRALITDGEKMAKEIKRPEARDAALIASAQSVELYEVGGYGTARSWASLLGYDQIAELLDESLQEESASNEKLSGLAEGGINEEALPMDEGDDTSEGGKESETKD